MSTFRQQPDLRTTLWVPLRPVASHLEDPFGAVKIAATYHSKDCVPQGYLFALFCGLVPLSWMDTLATAFSSCDDNLSSKTSDRIWSPKVSSSRKAKRPSDAAADSRLKSSSNDTKMPASVTPTTSSPAVAA
ncbi:unnamed protein product [Ectocarpus sp. CCAP 1310/34]|nr:unnamed protein product [Ectocarpus sp. CCAP 1310/34]